MNFRQPSISLLTAAAFILMGLSSCGDIEQNLKLNEDGSGTMETSFDIGEMISMTKGMGDLGALQNEDITISSSEEPDTMIATSEKVKDPMELIMEKITDPAYDRDFDTLISFLTIIPDSVKEKEKRLDLVSKISLRMKSPASSASLVMGIVMNFDNKDQLAELIDYIENMDNASNSGMLPTMGGGGMQSEAFLVFDVDMKAGWIRVDTMDYGALAPEMGMSVDSIMSTDEMGMMEMMFGNTKIKSIIQVPGDVTSCSNKDAIITKDNRVIVEYGLMDAVKKGKVPGYTIYFTPKK